MKFPQLSRRLATSLFLFAGFALNTFHTIAAEDSRQYYELRVYATKSETQQKRINDYWQQAAAAYNRLGIKPVGVFTESQDSATNNIYVLLPYDSLAAFEKSSVQLASDPAFQKAGADFLNAPKTNAAFESMEISLLSAFDGMKRMSIPAADKKPEVFELRTYISSSENKGLNKIQMFESGEISVMKEVGLAPVFYGRKIAGANMPCLVYMTSGENADEHKKHWSGFGAAPVWKQLQADAQYKDNMIRMIRVMLKRTPASQL